MDYTKSQIRNSKPVVVDLINRKTLVVTYYPGIRIAGKEMPLSSSRNSPMPYENYDKAMVIAEETVKEMKTKFLGK